MRAEEGLADELEASKDKTRALRRSVETLSQAAVR